MITMRGLFYLRQGDEKKAHSLSRNKKRQERCLIRTAQEGNGQRHRLASNSTTENRMVLRSTSLDASHSNQDEVCDSLMKICGEDRGHGSELVVTGHRKNSGKSHQSLRLNGDVFDSLISLHTSNSTGIIEEKSARPRSKPRKHISSGNSTSVSPNQTDKRSKPRKHISSGNSTSVSPNQTDKRDSADSSHDRSRRMTTVRNFPNKTKENLTIINQEVETEHSGDVSEYPILRYMNHGDGDGEIETVDQSTTLNKQQLSIVSNHSNPNHYVIQVDQSPTISLAADGQSGVVSIETSSSSSPTRFESHLSSDSTQVSSQIVQFNLENDDMFNLISPSDNESISHNSFGENGSRICGDEQSEWTRKLSQVRNFQSKHGHSDVPLDSELGVWLRNIILTLSSVGSRNNIKELIDAGVDWAYSHFHRDNNQCQELSRVVRHVSEDAVSELFDVTTGKQESVTSSITTNSSAVLGIEKDPMHLCKPKRKTMTLTKRINGRRDNLLKWTDHAAFASGRIKRKRSNDLAFVDYSDNSMDPFIYHKNLCSMGKSVSKKNYVSSDGKYSWSDMLIGLESFDGPKIDSDCKRKRLTHHIGSDDPSADVLQRLFDAPRAIEGKSDEKSREDMNKNSLALVLFDSSSHIDNYSMTLYEMFRDVSCNTAT